MTPESSTTEISVIVPSHNEGKTLPILLEKIARGSSKIEARFEVILIDDGSTDQTSGMASEISKAFPQLRILRNPKRRGISASVTAGIKEARGNILVFLPADLQSDPEEDIPKLISAMTEDIDVVAGVRKGRADGRERSSSAYNRLVNWLFSIEGQDLNWIKATRREFASGIELRGGWYRLLIPILVSRGARMTQVETNWHPRIHGRSNFSVFRFIPFLWDIVAVRFLISPWSQRWIPYFSVASWRFPGSLQATEKVRRR